MRRLPALVVTALLASLALTGYAEERKGLNAVNVKLAIARAGGSSADALSDADLETLLTEASARAGYGATIPEGFDDAMARVYDIAVEILQERNVASDSGGRYYPVNRTAGPGSDGGTEERWKGPAVQTHGDTHRVYILVATRRDAQTIYYRLGPGLGGGANLTRDGEFHFSETPEAKVVLGGIKTSEESFRAEIDNYSAAVEANDATSEPGVSGANGILRGVHQGESTSSTTTSTSTSPSSISGGGNPPLGDAYGTFERDLFDASMISSGGSEPLGYALNAHIALSQHLREAMAFLPEVGDEVLLMIIDRQFPAPEAGRSIPENSTEFRTYTPGKAYTERSGSAGGFYDEDIPTKSERTGIMESPAPEGRTFDDEVWNQPLRGIGAAVDGSVAGTVILLVPANAAAISAVGSIPFAGGALAGRSIPENSIEASTVEARFKKVMDGVTDRRTGVFGWGPEGSFLAVEVDGGVWRLDPVDFTTGDAKATPWKHHNVQGLDAPTLEFTSGDPYRLQVELFFDRYEEGKSVREATDKIEKLALVNQELHRPPTALLTWGTGLAFQIVIENSSLRFTLFQDDGTPLRGSDSNGPAESAENHNSSRSNKSYPLVFVVGGGEGGSGPAESAENHNSSRSNKTSSIWFFGGDGTNSGPAGLPLIGSISVGVTIVPPAAPSGSGDVAVEYFGQMSNPFPFTKN